MSIELLARLWGKQKGWAFIGRKSSDGKWSDRSFRYPSQANLLVNEAESWNKVGDSVYFCPHLFSDAVRQKTYALELPALYADLDEVNPATLSADLRPTVAWESSHGRYAALWLLTEPIDPKEGEAINKRLTYKIGADKGGWDLTQYLRWPGSINYKYDPPHKGKVLWADGQLFDSSVFAAELPTVTTEEQPAVQQITEIPAALVVLASRIPIPILAVLKRAPNEDEDRSKMLCRIYLALAEAGFSFDEIFSLVKQSAWNKFRERGDHVLIADINKVISQLRVENTEQVVEQHLEFLTLDEVLASVDNTQWLVRDIWMDTNVGWIAGVGKNYKSVISLDLGLSVASGTPFLGKFTVALPGPVLMIQEEDPTYRVRNRLKAMMKSKKLHTETGFMGWIEPGKKYRMVDVVTTSDIPLHLAIGQGFSFTDPAKLEQLEAMIDKTRPKLVVLDPFYVMAVGIDEYKAGEITAIFNEIKRMRNRYGCGFAIVHHFKKGAGAPSERLYGSMAFYAFSENTFWVSREGQVVTIERDIKDAMFDNPITLEVINLEPDYKISVRDGQSLIHDLVRVLSDVNVGTPVTVEDVTLQLGAKRYEVARVLEVMQEKGWVTVDTGGRGSAKRVISLPAISGATEELRNVSSQ